jgi:dihydropyrimidine dehydrogenase (NAD+) subunit PreT
MSTELLQKNIIRDDWVNTEAWRCLSCFDPPCQKACPASIPIPEFIYSITTGNINRAAVLVQEANPMASICGAVCPQEIFCQSACTRGKIDGSVEIKNLHSFATRLNVKSETGVINQKYKIAIIGAGPAGLSAAITLAKEGYAVTIFEKNAKAGGVPGVSIPSFRLSDDAIKHDINYAIGFAIELKLNHQVDEPLELLNEYNAVLIASGLEIIRRLDVPGEDLPDMTDAITFLSQVRSGKIKELNGKRVAVIGGGNVSLDVASTAASLGASEVRLLYRRSPVEMKVWRSELLEAQERGIIFEFLTAPVGIMGDGGSIEAVNCIKMQLDERLDSSGRRTVEPILGSEFMQHADLVITAVGLLSEFMKDITINPDLSTSIPGLYAAGDWAKGEGTIVEAVRDGKLAANSIINYLKDKSK